MSGLQNEGADKLTAAFAVDGAQGRNRKRRNEQVGGGFFVFRRGTRTGRIKTGSILAGKPPFEHPSAESAISEACRLHTIYGGQYDVFELAMSIGRRGDKPDSLSEGQS